MAFLISGGNTLAFAVVDDVHTTDQRLFEANEGLTDIVVEDALVRATERICTLLKATDWYRDLVTSKQPGYVMNSIADLPDVDPNKIIGRENDFTDLCVYYALWAILLPRIADFNKEDNAERAKIGFYQEKYNFRFEELVNAGDWYDLQGLGYITSVDKMPGHLSLRRVR